MTLTWKIEQRDPETHVALQGGINGQSDLTPIASEIAPGGVVFDLSGIKRIDSLGVRSWLLFMQVLRKKGVPIAHERCSPPMFQQMGMINGFEGGGVVRSIFVPYDCSACQHVENRLVEQNQELPPETQPCPKCGASMDLDDLEEFYETWRAAYAGA